MLNVLSTAGRNRSRRRISAADDLLPVVDALWQARSGQSVEAPLASNGRRRRRPQRSTSREDPVVTWEAYNYRRTGRYSRAGGGPLVGTNQRGGTPRANTTTHGPALLHHFVSAEEQQQDAAVTGHVAVPGDRRSCSSAACSARTSIYSLLVFRQSLRPGSRDSPGTFGMGAVNTAVLLGCSSDGRAGRAALRAQTGSKGGLAAWLLLTLAAGPGVLWAVKGVEYKETIDRPLRGHHMSPAARITERCRR